MDDALLRAFRAHRQGLDGSLAGSSPAQVLERAGWARSVGGVGPYLALFARAGIRREAADRAAAALEVHELPTARGCTYVLPASDFALGLKVGETFADSDMRAARKLGVTDAEIDDLGKAVVGALAKGPLSPDDIRAATGGKSRSLGEDGKKKGIPTTLPLALGRLQASGEIRRVPVNGRLDQQRYRYARWTPNPLANLSLSLEEAYTELARRFFRWIQPATVPELQTFAGLGVKASRAAVEPLGLVPLKDRPELLVFPDVVSEIAAFEPSEEPHYTLVSSIDSAALLRGDVRSLLDARDRERSGVGEKGERVGLSGLAYLPNHGIFDRGRLVGLWEFDADAGEIVWTSFVERTSALEEAVAATEAYIKEDLGDARSFSLDSPRSRGPRVAALRETQPA